MKPLSTYLKMAAIILLALWGIVFGPYSIDPVNLLYKCIIVIVTIGMIFLAWKRPLIAAGLSLAITLLLVWGIIQSKPFLEAYGIQHITVWMYIKVYGLTIAPVILSSLLLFAASLYQHFSFKNDG
ncbi:MAG: hypothetical protein JW963_14685 [Anaerolineales bacterium]|nr:hypothetical protein [Anaerolineales bacterium]